MANKADVYNADTTEDEGGNVYDKDTVCTPHQVLLTYPANLDPGVVEAFNIPPRTKGITEFISIQRTENADVSLTDSQYPRNFIQIQLRNINGDVVCVVRNQSDNKGKVIKLKYQNRSSTVIESKEEASLLNNSVTISSLKLVFHCEIIPGDMNASKYTLTTSALPGEIFNQQFLLSPSVSRSLSRPSDNAVSRPDGEQTIPKMAYPINNLNGSQYYPQVQYPLNQSLPTGYNINPSLPNLSHAVCNQCSADCNQSIQPTQFPCCQYPLPGGQFGPSRLHTTTPHGFSQPYMPMTMHGAPGVHQSYTMNQHYPPRQHMQPQYRNGEGQSHVNWHSLQPTDPLPIGPVIGVIPDPRNTVNTHPIQQQSSHDFNPNLINEYTRKDSS